jgi:hypothetical protein
VKEIYQFLLTLLKNITADEASKVVYDSSKPRNDKGGDDYMNAANLYYARYQNADQE